MPALFPCSYSTRFPWRSVKSRMGDVFVVSWLNWLESCLLTFLMLNARNTSSPLVNWLCHHLKRKKPFLYYNCLLSSASIKMTKLGSILLMTIPWSKGIYWASKRHGSLTMLSDLMLETSTSLGCCVLNMASLKLHFPFGNVSLQQCVWNVE